MKTVCLLGSPRRGGNSDQLAARFCTTAVGAGAEVEQIALSELNYSGCLNLFRCKQDLTHCAQKDDLTAVLEKVAAADVLVLASPVYFTNISGGLKLAIDRFFSFFVPDYPTAEFKSRLGTGKKLVFIQTQGEPEDRYGDLLEGYSKSFEYLGFNKQYLIRAWGVREPGEVLSNEGFMNRCHEVVAKVYGT